MTSMKRGLWQSPLPLRKVDAGPGYDILPSFILEEGLIYEGFMSLAGRLLQERVIIIDGYNGVLWDLFEEAIRAAAADLNLKVEWIHTVRFLKPEAQIREMTSPWSGGNDPLFGRRCTLQLADFFEMDKMKAVIPDSRYDISIILGPGASLAGWQGLTVYADLPKNEQQYRSREGLVTNLGLRNPINPKEFYKRSYFIDWPVLNMHKGAILESVDIFVDAQRPDEPAWTEGDILRFTLRTMSRSIFRVRPWFEPGPWGGTWIKDKIYGLDGEAPNYAWSFELITPENGLLLESSSILLEVSFDCLMFLAADAVLGSCHSRFGTEFPIRFDFLDTFDGGNLSLQCHPRPEYTLKHFGESFTQEEAYYILDTKDNAVVYLGFMEDIDPVEFRAKLDESQEKKVPFEAERFIMSHPAAKHDLFLIPYGTVHGSGKNNLVLEISTTPYIFTFKMYDWLRMDLSGQPRDLNIARAMENLFFDRKGRYVTDNLKTKPVLLEKGDGWQTWHLPTHETHLYDVHRHIIKTSAMIPTGNRCLVMNLVGGDRILVETQNGINREISYAETFVIPAAAGSINVTNLSEREAVLVKAFIK
jgi:mannose-6-phosphate isomerase class I